ncbi:hypothetical protein O181_113473 [Austropuccinia psidii MF-1]|uniref:Uncharacterized protein n=1 Tax=Austropuccinia psidii MF-1 TaxID=1389203 RepID=A0A9Q3K2I0_9BASI|nr:hypothetical protein [Austropuccinia psidii MF-1]
MVTSLLDLSEVIIWPVKDGDGKRTFKLGLIVTNGIQTPKTKPPESPPQDSPVPSLPCKQTPRQPTPGPSGTQWSEELFRGKQPKTLPNQRATYSWPKSIPQPPEDNMTREAEPEVAPTQSTEEPFACPATPRSIIIIDNTPVGSPPPPPTSSYPTCPPSPSVPPSPVQRPSHLNNGARQEFTNL